MRTEAGSAGVVKPRILVVEDDKSSRSALMALLRLTGFDALQAGTVSEGIDRLNENPACMILDLMLPDGNGSTLLRHIRERNLPVRVVVTTGAIDWEHMLAGSHAPPDAVFQKPIDFRRLIDWLHTNAYQ